MRQTDLSSVFCSLSSHVRSVYADKGKPSSHVLGGAYNKKTTFLLPSFSNEKQQQGQLVNNKRPRWYGGGAKTPVMVVEYFLSLACARKFNRGAHNK